MRRPSLTCARFPGHPTWHDCRRGDARRVQSPRRRLVDRGPPAHRARPRRPRHGPLAPQTAVNARALRPRHPVHVLAVRACRSSSSTAGTGPPAPSWHRRSSSNGSKCSTTRSADTPPRLPQPRRSRMTSQHHQRGGMITEPKVSGEPRAGQSVWTANSVRQLRGSDCSCEATDTY